MKNTSAKHDKQRTTTKKKTTRIATKPRLLNRDEINKIFDELHALWPNARCELQFNNDFQLLLAVILSAQTTDKAVNKALEPLLKASPHFSPIDLVKLGEKKFLNVIKSIGLAPTKAKNSVATARQLILLHEGRVPLDRQALEALPGVGRKTANVVLNVLAKMPTVAIDTHVARVSVRLGLVSPTNNRLLIEEHLLQRIPKKWLLNAHHLLIFHGRYHCTARSPRCLDCPVATTCLKQGVEVKH